MRVCIVIQNNHQNDIFNNFLISAKNLKYDVSIGESIINEDFQGSKINDLTNLIEKDLLTKEILSDYSDIYVFTDFNWSSAKSITRMLKSIEEKLINVQTIYLYDSDSWMNFVIMLKNFAGNGNQTEILNKIKLVNETEFEIN
jgi:hypothetical protein